ncbi:ADP-ribosylglycohydrolase family protein [Poseidonibacter lekithochrous]|uniref:ADP-ribosylglycohydrolase family protein n=1 Tax=Poseidonibacter TaxID=2321187 RepID=UPI001C0A16A3|nr:MULTISPECIES: ADP-ribosylglycohydrolase family protein [Poseidonibacter]MBU3013952.1 ADP-ribosylglycohydrolase family protein [Poseidonibacter lekithochrous]MDO6827247.1 ADP-ribosylglycohydrolase family protein [Poseidonibacter sp. 1_MG-2023]
MFDEKKVKELILTSLVTDAYCLGSHWVYDEKQLKENDLNWNELNNPLSVWHKDKSAGEFTHYGDQTYWLYEFLQNKETFEENEYIKFWEERIKSYDGYIDGATRETLENIKNNVTPSGSNSSDLSIVGRIAPLLLVSNSKKEFVENVEKFVKLTHNSEEAVNAAIFFAKVLLECLDGKDVISAIESIKQESNTTIQAFVQKGLESKTDDTFEAIREFGPACDVSEGFSGIIHLLSKYTNLKDMLICNARAGGDSSARGMIAAIIFMANQPSSQIPQSWLAIKKVI